MPSKVELPTTMLDNILLWIVVGCVDDGVVVVAGNSCLCRLCDDPPKASTKEKNEIVTTTITLMARLWRRKEELLSTPGLLFCVREQREKIDDRFLPSITTVCNSGLMHLSSTVSTRQKSS